MHSVRALFCNNVHSLYVQKLWGGAYTRRVSSGRQRSASNVVVLRGLTSVIRPSLFVNPNSISSQATSKLLPKFLNGALKHSGPNEPQWRPEALEMRNRYCFLWRVSDTFMRYIHSLTVWHSSSANIPICFSKVSAWHLRIGCRNWKFCVSSISLESNCEIDVPLKTALVVYNPTDRYRTLVISLMMALIQCKAYLFLWKANEQHNRKCCVI